MMMILGLFVFSLPTLAYQSLERQTSWRHSSSDRVGARAAHQYVGPGEETIDLAGVIVAELAGMPISLELLRRMADQGRPLPLVDGTGIVHGAYVITSIKETRTLFFRDGAARKIEFSLSLQRVDESALAALLDFIGL